MAGKVWKDGSRRGIAYVEDREAAEKVIALAAAKTKKAKAPAVQEAKPLTAPNRRQRQAKTVSPQEVALQTSGAMAVYWDRKGRPFAWQIPFDLACWEQVARVVGVEP